MYIAAFVFAPLAAPEPALGSDFSSLPLQLTAVVPPGSRRKLPNFPVWLITTNVYSFTSFFHNCMRLKCIILKILFNEGYT